MASVVTKACESDKAAAFRPALWKVTFGCILKDDYESTDPRAAGQMLGLCFMGGSALLRKAA